MVAEARFKAKVKGGGGSKRALLGRDGWFAAV